MKMLMLFALLVPGECRNVMKRTTLPLPASMEVVDKYVAMGCELMELMFATEGEVIAQRGPTFRARFSQSNLAISAWKLDSNKQPTVHDLQALIPYLYKVVPPIRIADKTNTFVVSDDSRRWSDSTYSLSGHGVRYRNVMSFRARVAVLVASESSELQDFDQITQDVESPRSLSRNRRWYDVAFLHYAQGYGVRETANQVHPNRQRKAPLWFLIKDMQGPQEALSVVAWCLMGAGMPAATAWPGTTFPIGSTCFEALLSSSVGAEIAMFLITHKYRFGVAVLGSVTIFSDGEGKELNILWWATDDDLEALRVGKEDNRRFEFVNPLTAGSAEAPFPIPFRPMMA